MYKMICVNPNTPEYQEILKEVHNPLTANEIYRQRYLKDGVDFVFEQNPELQSIGTYEEYSSYLDTIFPDSQVKDIVYHGTKSNEVRTMFDKETIQKTGVGLGKGFFFAGDKSYSQRDVYKYKIIGAYLLNLKNPVFGFPTTFIEENRINDVPKEYLEQYSDEKELKKLDDSERTKLMQKLGYDGVVYKQGEYANENVVFDPEQIHILGSQKDIKGFKEYLENKKVSEKQLTDEKLELLKIARESLSEEETSIVENLLNGDENFTDMSNFTCS